MTFLVDRFTARARIIAREAVNAHEFGAVDP